ncbi:uncharacterized protein YecE (DUF72 family) [Kutzneria kofuensis]|uniref:Uncharacterized protein YecE (DUF72 family) n=1 Tax=Kutzneria kofuensis TaxID=103725 RepID=A0A7W9KL50_9PSEU|nr:uncharacterized protein YecE (DUF72 family) [Kutzneria kofuensis]
MIRIGTSGWVYPPWRGTFYPKGVTQKRELAYLAERLNSVEINGTFYGRQRPASFRSWAAQTPDDFVFATKAPRFITHMKRLRDAETPVANFFASGVLMLQNKIGPILWQLPATFRFDADVLAEFLGLLPQSTAAAAKLSARHDHRIEDDEGLRIDADRPLRHALEPRHVSFQDEKCLRLLRDHNVALVVADTAKKWPYFEELTADFAYARLHGDVELYTSGYTDEALDRWAAKVREWHRRGDVHVYFDNDAKVRAPVDAIGLSRRLGIG